MSELDEIKSPHKAGWEKLSYTCMDMNDGTIGS
jgi:hypothetical protein